MSVPRRDSGQPAHMFLRPRGCDWERDCSEIPADLKRMRQCYRAMTPLQQMMTLTILHLYLSRKDTVFLLGGCPTKLLAVEAFEQLLGDGSQYGIHLQYKVQPSPDGLAQAFILGEEFIGDDCCAMILGDNIFYGNGFSKILKTAAANAENKGRCTVFGYYVQDPERFGIVEFDKDGKVLSVEEKPQHPKSNYAITGLYFYNKEVVQMAKQVKPSARGELEITTLNDMYLKKDELDVQLLGRGFAWLDTGTMESLVDAADFVRMVEKRQGIKISAPEEIAFKYGWIDRDTLLESAQRYGKSPYGQHLKNVADGKLRY